MPNLKIDPGSSLLFVGDSITDQNRERPLPELWSQDLGRGYVGLVNAILAGLFPSSDIQINNLGVSASEITHLEERWSEDVIEKKPDWVSLMIGINDVERQFRGPVSPNGTSPSVFRDTMNRLVDRTLPCVEGMILMTPYYLEPNREEPVRKRMDEYRQIVKEVAQSKGLLCVDTQVAFDGFLENFPTQSLATDRIHPGLSGHMIIARAFLNEIGLNIPADYSSPGNATDEMRFGSEVVSNASY